MVVAAAEVGSGGIGGGGGGGGGGSGSGREMEWRIGVISWQYDSELLF